MHDRHDLGMLCRVEDDPLSAGVAQSRFTTRLRLAPAGPANAHDLWLVHNDDEVSQWYDKERPSLVEVEQQAKSMGDSWRFHGVHKWVAYDRVSGDVVGRGGLSRTPVDDDWGQIYALLPAEPWVRVAHEVQRFPDDRSGNTALAEYLWGYRFWTRAEQLRGLSTPTSAWSPSATTTIP